LRAEQDHRGAASWYALLAAILFGLSTPLAKGLLAEVSPQILAGLFYLASGIGLMMLRLPLQRRTIHMEASLSRKDAPWLSGAVVFGGILGPVLLLKGLVQTPVSNASLLLNLEVVFTVIIAQLAFHENIDRKASAGITAIILGGAFITWQPFSVGGELLGPLAIALACLCWAIDNNLTQKVSAGDPREVAAIKGLVAGTVNISLGLLFGDTLPGIEWLGAAMLVGFFSYGLSLMLFVLALRNLGTARTGAYFSMGPFIGAVIGLIWGEPITVFLVAAAVAMAVGVWFLSTEQHGHPHVHAALVHAHRHVHDEHHQHAHGPSDPAGEPHSHLHEHRQLAHSHKHYPDIHHRHSHNRKEER